MTRDELNKLVKKYYWYSPKDNFKTMVYSVDSKHTYGVTRIKIIPVIGTGAVWVRLDKNRIDPIAIENPTEHRPVYEFFNTALMNVLKG